MTVLRLQTRISLRPTWKQWRKYVLTNLIYQNSTEMFCDVLFVVGVKSVEVVDLIVPTPNNVMEM